MRIARQNVSAVLQCRCVDDAVGGGELAPRAYLGGQERDFCVERRHRTHLDEGDNLIGFCLSRLTGQSLNTFKLNTCRHKPGFAIGNKSLDRHAGP